MANVKKIKLPNNTTVDLIDSRIPGVDTTPTTDSTNVVTSGGVRSALSSAFSDLSSSVETPLSATIGEVTKTVTTLYATTANRPTQYRGTDEVGGYDLNTVLRGGGAIRNVSSKTYWAHAPSELSFSSAVVQVNPGNLEPLAIQFAYNVNYEGTSPTDKIWWRVRNSDGWSDDWHLFYDSSNLTQSALANLLGTYYLPTAGGTMTGAVVLGNEIGIRGSTTGSDDFPLIKMSSSNNIVVGGTTTGIGNVNIYGANINLCAGGSSSVATVEPTGVSVTGAVTASGLGTFDTITLTNTSAATHINFSRANWNYINAPTNGAVCVSIGGSGAANAISVTNADGIRPGTGSTYDLGISAARWANVYADNGDLSGTLSVTGQSTLAGGAVATSAENKGYRLTGSNYDFSLWLGSGGTNRGIYGHTESDWLLYFDASNTIAKYGNLLPGSNATQDLGASATRWNNVYTQNASLIKTGGATLTFQGTTLNNQEHTILFRGNDTDSNGFKIGTTPATSYGRQSLGFYRSNVTSGSSPYTPDWKRVLYMPYTGGVEVGTSSNSENLTVNGNISVASASNIVFSGSNQTLNDILGDIETLINAL